MSAAQLHGVRTGSAPDYDTRVKSLLSPPITSPAREVSDARGISWLWPSAAAPPKASLPTVRRRSDRDDVDVRSPEGKGKLEEQS